MRRLIYKQTAAILLALALLFPLASAAEDSMAGLTAGAANEEGEIVLGGGARATPAPELLAQNPKGVPRDVTLGARDTYAIDVEKAVEEAEDHLHIGKPGGRLRG